MGSERTHETDQLPALDADAPDRPSPGFVLVFTGGRPIFRPVRVGDDNGMSGKHLEISFDGVNWHVRDLGSRNGTYLGLRRIDHIAFAAFPEPGAGPDILCFGDTVAITVPDLASLGSGPRLETLGAGASGSFVVGARLQRVLDLVAAAARTRATVLIEGESGTGKKLVARHYHRSGARPGGPFVAVDVGATRGPIADAEYRGFRKGSHSMATEDRKGFWQQAHGGTLFLDELANMPEDIQAASLRVMQEREVRPMGSDRSVKVDVDVVAATNRDLREESLAGRFKFDLYQRFAGQPVRVPALRERVEEIPWIVAAVIEEAARAGIAGARRPGREFVVRALGYEWPGNVRELRSVAERAVRDEGGGGGGAGAKELSGKHVPLGKGLAAGKVGSGAGAVGSAGTGQALNMSVSVAPPVAGGTAQGGGGAGAMTLEEAEKEAIVRALRATGANQTKAAAILGIDRATLRAKIRKYGLMG